MGKINLYMFPALVVIWFPITFLVTLLIAVKLNHVNLLFPYISDSGTFSPESCIFGQMLNMGAVLLVFVMYMRYLFIKELYRSNNLPNNILRLNKTSKRFGIASVIGISIVANFQETNVWSIHLLGAGLAFGCATIYLLIQTYMSFMLFPITGTKCIIYARVVCCTVAFFAFILSFVTGAIAAARFKGKDMTKWKPEDGGYEFHFMSAVTEWIMTMWALLYFLTYMKEFKYLTLYEPILCCRIKRRPICPCAYEQTQNIKT